jgi:hypothetical protein
MHYSTWIKQENLTYAEAARRCDLPNRATARAYALGMARPRPDRQRHLFIRTGGKVALADWYPEMRGATGELTQVNGVAE